MSMTKSAIEIEKETPKELVEFTNDCENFYKYSINFLNLFILAAQII